MKRILVDMSVSLLHHGHVRLLQKARELGHVIVALTSDEEILKYKGTRSELSFEERKEMLLALRYVDEVVKSPWTINDDFLKKHNADLLFHSGPNFNEVSSVLSCDRTDGVSTSDLRQRAVEALVLQRNSNRCLLTPGPTNLHPENIFDIRPVFSRGDDGYLEIEQRVLSRILALAGQDSIVTMQGSATTAIEVASSNFLTGKVAVVLSGYYSQRIFQMLQIKSERLGLSKLSGLAYEEVMKARELLQEFDWVVAAYTETADAFLVDLEDLRSMVPGKLMIDATGSINLEPKHQLADVCMFSSCKGLGGLAGAGFISFNKVLLANLNGYAKEFILDLNTFVEKKTTSPVHAICSLDSISAKFEQLGMRVRQSKDKFLQKFGDHLFCKTNQPTLCTKLKGVHLKAPPNAVSYSPRTRTPGTQVICHLFDQAPSNREPGDLYEQMTAETSEY